ncbi:MAG: Rrf2 family transcriptional regulator [Desulfuromonadaceae bacterium]|nr:Rrf2 family transcriptional regulator [Desulfuromonadaceae bacterium]
MVITRATEYAIRAVLFMAKFPPGEIILKKDICQTQDVTPAFLTKIFQPLVKAGLIGSQRGVGGGFYLKKSPSEITVFDIYCYEEDPLLINKCLAEKGACERDGYCPVHEAWCEVRRGMMVKMKEYNFARLAQEEVANKERLDNLLQRPE